MRRVSVKFSEKLQEKILGLLGSGVRGVASKHNVGFLSRQFGNMGS